MTATGHALVGTALSATISNPIIGIPVALISHVFCDLFPHWDSGTHIKEKTQKRFVAEAVLDVLLSATLTYLTLHFIFPKVNLLYGFAMAFSAQLLDWITMLYVLLKIKIKPIKLIYNLQVATNKTWDKPWGIIDQATLVIVLISLIKIAKG